MNAREALERARRAWEAAGRPGAQEQLSFFAWDRLIRLEREAGLRADQPRKRR